MQKMKLVLPALTFAMCMMPGVSVAAEQPQAGMQAGTQKRDTVYGSQLMTRKERAEYHAKMRSLKTPEEREALRMEHHRKMQERARAMGKTLPDMSPQGGGMMKPCPGPGPCGEMRQQGGAAGY